MDVDDIGDQLSNMRESISLDLEIMSAEINEIEDWVADFDANCKDDRVSMRAVVRRFERKIKKIDQRIAAIEQKIGLG